MKRNKLLFTLLTATIFLLIGCLKAEANYNNMVLLELTQVSAEYQDKTVDNSYISKKFVPQVSYYEMNGEKSFSVSDEYKTDKFSYGDNTLGSFYITGGVDNQSKNNGFSVYSSSNEIKLSYNYEKTYHTKNEDDWNLVESDAEKVAGVSLNKDINYGAILVQRSNTGIDNWKTVYKKTNAFDSSADRTKLLEFYSISEQDAREENYYRIVVCYEMKRRTKEKWFLVPDNYKIIRCVEVYGFYLNYNSNPVSLLDIYSRDDISNNKTVKNGFIIDKGGSNFSVSLRKENQKPYEVSDKISVCEPGEYTVLINSSMNDSYQYNIKVTDGLDVYTLSPNLYEGGKKGEYKEKETPSETGSFGDDSLSKLKLQQNYGKKIKTKSVGNINKYGFNGDSVSICLSLSSPSNSNYRFYADDYGKKDKQKVNGVKVGTVNTGALIIQKSSNGSDWEKIDQASYADGLSTTDFSKYYANNGDILIYTPDGHELINGLYLKISFAYALENKKTEDITRCLEVYNMYLCSNNLETITFHNLSVTEKLEQEIGDDKDVDATIYKKAETLLTGSETVSGFQIDTSSNPTVKYTVKRNNQNIELSGDTFKSPGKYEIFLKSAVDDERKVEIFVDTQTSEQALKTYFNEGFLDGKRIYSEGNYPKYEGGLTKYKLSDVDKQYPALSGTIKNITTGKEIIVSSSYSEKTGEITEAGHYIAEFSTRPKDKADDFPGDYRVFIFEFDIIQNGTAPGPICNQKNLNTYSISNVSDSYPMYYSLTYSSASKGDITLAFSSREAAKEYAYNYEKGKVEKQSDGSFRYSGSFSMEKKEKFNDTWDLTDAINYFSDAVVQRGYFDLSDQFNYLTLTDENISKYKNLRTLELNKSITIFADNEKEKLCSKNKVPIISPKPYAYLLLSDADSVDSGYHDFEFVKDKYECDSSKVFITDVNGNEYNIEYGKGVGKQLQDNNCPSGKVTIHEETVYGDKTSYEAVFIAEGDNTASISIMYYQDGKQIQKTLDKQNADETIAAQAFEIERLTDDLDPYSLVSIVATTDDNKESTQYFVADQSSIPAFTDNGKYEIKVINRLGYTYSFYVNISGSTYATLLFTGEGTDDTSAIFTSRGTKNIELPKLVRYGYELVGFRDEDNILYSSKVEQILFCGTKVLEAEWKAKQFQMILTDEDGKEIGKKTIEFGKPITLEEAESVNDKKFDCWKFEGQRIKDMSFTLDKESDVTLVASYKKQILQVEETKSSDSDKRSSKPIFLFVAAAISISAIVIYKKGKNRNTKENDDEVL